MPLGHCPVTIQQHHAFLVKNGQVNFVISLNGQHDQMPSQSDRVCLAQVPSYSPDVVCVPTPQLLGCQLKGLQ